MSDGQSRSRYSDAEQDFNAKREPVSHDFQLPDLTVLDNDDPNHHMEDSKELRNLDTAHFGAEANQNKEGTFQKGH